jgi:Ca2+-binding RTX toxin-like protein
VYLTMTAQLNPDSSSTSSVQINLLGGAGMEVASGAMVSAVVNGGSGSLLLNNGDLYGTFIGGSLDTTMTGGLHTDLDQFCK